MVVSTNSAKVATLELRGKETPRLWTKPVCKELTRRTSLGFEAIDFAHDVLGVSLLPWQRWLLIHALELDAFGMFRFKTVIVQVARQNGKTTLLQVLALWRLYVDRAALVIGAAQDLDVAEETWEGCVDMAEGVPDLKAEIGKVEKTNGRKALKLKTGERYKPKAATRRAGRGLSGDLVALDELREHQNWAAWGAITKTTMARERAQIWGLSNAGDKQSVVLAHLRKVAITDLAAMGDSEGIRELKTLLEEGEEPPDDVPDDADDSLGIFEWSAPPGCDKWDRDGWAQANPALGYTITERALSSSAKTDDDAVFRTECLCQWVDDLEPPLFGRGVWEERTDVESALAEGTVYLAVEVSVDRAWSSIVAAGRREDGDIHVEITGRNGILDHRRGTRWVVDRVKEIKDTLGYNVLVLVDRGGPAFSLVPALEAAGIEMEILDASGVTSAAATLYDLVEQKRIWHLGQSDLDAAAIGARERTIGDKWGIGRRLSQVDVSPLVAASFAAYWVETQAVDVLNSVW